MSFKTYLLHFFDLILQFLHFCPEHFVFDQNVSIVLSFERIAIIIFIHIFIASIHFIIFGSHIENSRISNCTLIVVSAIAQQVVIEFRLDLQLGTRGSFNFSVLIASSIV